MSKRANPTLVGLFVIIGIVIAVATVLLLSSGQLFSTKVQYVLYFNESVNGLQKGAPVKFKGVTIGAVDEILIHYESQGKDIHIPVIIHLNADQIIKNLEVTLHTGVDGAYVDFVNHLVGRLESDSLVTGRMYIGLRYDPNSDALRSMGHSNIDHPEIPSEPSTFQAITDQLENIDIVGIAARVKLLIDKVNASLDQIAFDEINAELIAAIKSIRAKIEATDIDSSLAAFNKAMAAAERTLNSLEQTSAEIHTLSSTAEGQIEPLMEGVRQTTAKAAAALKTIETTAEELRKLVTDQSPAYLKVMKTLDELNLLARSIRELTDKINRDPRMFLTGQPKPK